MFRRSLLAAVLVLGSLSAEGQGNGLVGAWRAVAYKIGGVAHPMQGLFLFTSHYYSANVRFRLIEGPIDDANGNAGPYKVIGDEIIFEQWVQVHVRPEDRKQPVLSHEGKPERTRFRREGNKLILLFPSGNSYVLERVADQ